MSANCFSFCESSDPHRASPLDPAGLGYFHRPGVYGHCAVSVTGLVMCHVVEKTDQFVIEFESVTPPLNFAAVLESAFNPLKPNSSDCYTMP